MTTFTQTVDRVYSEISRNKKPFFVVFFVIVLASYALLYTVDFIPEPVTQPVSQQEEDNEVVEVTTIVQEEAVEVESLAARSPLPTRIIFDRLDKKIAVLNPQSRDVSELDAALLSGVVRHPDSATLTEEGNVFILGHSSYLPNVFNKNFQAFNGIQDLQWGDIIRVQSEDSEYVYRVQRVYEAKASEVVVPPTPGKAQLTLATCDSFGSKDDRFIVEAHLIETKPL